MAKYLDRARAHLAARTKETKLTNEPLNTGPSFVSFVRAAPADAGAGRHSVLSGGCATCGSPEPEFLYLSPPHEPFCSRCVPDSPRRSILEDERCRHCRNLMAFYTSEGVPQCVAHYQGITDPA